MKHQTAELELLKANAEPASKTVAGLARRLALAHGLLDELDVLLFSIQPEPPALVTPLKRLRQRLSDMRGPTPFFRNPLNGPGVETGERVLGGSQELVVIRQRLLDAHHQLEKTERERDLAVSRLKEMARESGNRLR